MKANEAVPGGGAVFQLSPFHSQLFGVVDLHARPVRLEFCDERQVQRIDLVGGLGGDVLALDDERHVVGVVDHGAAGRLGGDADQDLRHGVDALEGFDARAEFGALCGGEFGFQPKVNAVIKHRAPRKPRRPAEANAYCEPRRYRVDCARPMKSSRFLTLCGLVAALVVPILSALELASPFSDHAVLQRDTAVPVWGWSDNPGATVTVAFGGQTKF